MDSIGTTASLVTLIDVAMRSVKLINNLVRNYHSAPAELIRLQHQVDGLKSQLALLRCVQQAVGGDNFRFDDVECTKTFERFIQDIIPLFQSMCD